jgi:hypothetical protein
MKREEAIRWVDDRMCWGRGIFTINHPFNFDECWEAGLMAIEALQIDLVQCKDCIHRETDDCPMYWVEWSIFEDCDGYTDDKYIVHDYTTDNGYCNYGERKDS